MIFGLEPWIAWLAMGFALLLIEFLIPGVIIVFFGLGAFCAALVAGFFPEAFNAQLLVFAVSSVLTLIFLRRQFRKVFDGKLWDKDQNITDFNIDMGKIIVVVEDIDPATGKGKVKYQGSLWPARSQDKIPAGASVRIIGLDNLTILVEKTSEENE